MPFKKKFGNNRGNNKLKGQNSKQSKFGKSRPQHKSNKPEAFLLQARLTEQEAGITEYLNKNNGFSGIVKARFSDFHVNEINVKGEVAKLTNTEIPNLDDFEENNVQDVENTDNSPLEEISQENWEKICKMVEDPEGLPIELDATNFTKDQRGLIHNTMKKVFGQKLVITTKTIEEKKVMEFKKFDKNDKLDVRIKWPVTLGKYVYFLVYKESIDTIHANLKISNCLNIKPSCLSYAGVKDRRAKTTQWFCAEKIPPWKLFVKTKVLRNIKIGNVAFEKEPLKLGQLLGNRFRIALRNVTVPDEQIAENILSVNDTGFINYYGLQRFGSDRDVPTFQIGLKLLQTNWKEACELILKPKKSDDPESDIALAKSVYFESKDVAKANRLITFSKNTCIEAKLLQGLEKSNSNDYVNALENIPRSMRLLYIHSYQSLIWNKVVSRRIKEFGIKCLKGDLVLLKGEDREVIETDSEEIQTEKSQVKVLTEEDFNNYTIYDIVLPLPGYDVLYPDNAVKNWYQELLEADGLSLDMAKQKVKTYNLSGAYRKIVETVQNFSWKTIRYNKPEDVLILSDIEELQGLPEPKDVPDGQYKAVILDFCLKSSSYATMVIRDILKTDTSALAHAKLNTYHEKNKVEDKKEDPLSFNNSLLSDCDKYEQFKKSIFGESSESCKRKSEDTEGNVTKKLCPE